MCNSWAFCINQTLWKKLTDNQINQIKNLIKLILRWFCNNNKKQYNYKKIVM